eukprot:4264703-Alexandrium_andersonii.AAC.1
MQDARPKMGLGFGLAGYQRRLRLERLPWAVPGTSLWSSCSALPSRPNYHWRTRSSPPAKGKTADR